MRASSRVANKMIIAAAVCFAWLCSAAATLRTPIANPRTFTVVGGGVGGLVAANLLARDGHNVTLVERGARVGGRMGSAHSGAGALYRFDVGPSLLLLPQVYRDTLVAVGVDAGQLELLEVTGPQYRVFFDSDGTSVDICRDPVEMQKTLDGIKAGAYESYRRYMDIATNYLTFGLPFVIEEDYRKVTAKLFFDFIRSCVSVFPLLSHQFMLELIFGRGEDKLHSMFSFQDLYIGLSPYESPAVFALLQSLELAEGVYYPRGGFGRVAELLREACETNGVRVVCNTSLAGYSSESGSTIKHAVFEGADGVSTIQSDFYVTNIDTPHHDQEFLCGVDGGYGTRPSCGVVSMNFAFSKRLGRLAHHNIFCAADRRESWRFLEPRGEFAEDNFNFYVHCPERSDTTVCPSGHDAITVLVPVPPLLPGEAGESDALLARRVRGLVLARLARASGVTADELEALVCSEEISSPADWRARFGLYRGQVFGLAHSLPQLSFLRARFQSSRFRNLFRVGASTRPGNGVPLVMVGARLCHKYISGVLNVRQEGR